MGREHDFLGPECASSTPLVRVDLQVPPRSSGLVELRRVLRIRVYIRLIDVLQTRGHNETSTPSRKVAFLRITPDTFV